MSWESERRKATQRAKAARHARAELRVLIGDRLVASADGINPLPPEKHGKAGTYTNWMCRCVPCSEVALAYMAKYDRKKKRPR